MRKILFILSLFLILSTSVKAQFDGQDSLHSVNFHATGVMIVNGHVVFKGLLTVGIVDLTKLLADTAIIGVDTITGMTALTNYTGDIANAVNPMKTIFLKGISMEEGLVSSGMITTALVDSGGIVARIVIPSTAVTANTRIIVSYQNCVDCGTLYISNRLAGTSFTVRSTNLSDRSSITCILLEPN